MIELEFTKEELRFIYTTLKLNESELQQRKSRFEQHTLNWDNENKNTLLNSVNDSIIKNQNILNKIEVFING